VCHLSHFGHEIGSLNQPRIGASAGEHKLDMRWFEVD